MLTLKDVVQVVLVNNGQYTFSSDVELPIGDFRVVLKLVKKAIALGYLELVTVPHPSSRTGQVDFVVVKITEAGIKTFKQAS